MKAVTVNTQIQFDSFEDEVTKEDVIKTLDAINEVLQQRFSDISPIIFTNAIDNSDIGIAENEDEE